MPFLRWPTGTPAPLARGVACHTRGDDRAPRRPCLSFTLLSRHVEPCFSARWWKKNRPARQVARAGRCRSLPGDGLWVCALSCACHGPPALVVLVPPVPPDESVAMNRHPAHAECPVRAIFRTDRRTRESRVPRLHGARRPRTRRLSGRWGLRAMEGEGLHHPGSFPFERFGGADTCRQPEKQKGSRVWMPPVHGSRGPGPADGSAVRRMTGPVNIGTRLPSGLSVIVGPGLCQGPVLNRGEQGTGYRGQPPTASSCPATA